MARQILMLYIMIDTCSMNSYEQLVQTWTSLKTQLQKLGLHFAVIFSSSQGRRQLESYFDLILSRLFIRSYTKCSKTQNQFLTCYLPFTMSMKFYVFARYNFPFYRSGPSITFRKVCLLFMSKYSYNIANLFRRQCNVYLGLVSSR